MRSIFLALVLLSFPAAAFSDAGFDAGRDAGIDAGFDGGVVDAGEPVKVELTGTVVVMGDAGHPESEDAGFILTEDGGVVFVQAALDHPLDSMQNFYVSAKEGKWWVAAMFMLLAVVGFFRVAGKKLHDWIPDDSAWDKPLFFIYETKVGGWLLNWLTAISGALFFAHQAGIPVDAGTWKTAFLASTGSTAIVELWQDISEWLKKRKEKKAAEAAALAAVVTKPVDPPAPPAAPVP